MGPGPEHGLVKTPQGVGCDFPLSSPTALTETEDIDLSLAQIGDKSGKKRRGILSRKQKVLASGVATITIAGLGAPQVIPTQVEWLETVISSNIARLFPQDNSKEITAEIDPNLELNKKAINAHENMLNTYRVPDKPLTGDKNKNEMLLFGSDSAIAVYATVWPYGRALDATYAMTLIPSIGDKYQGDYQKMLSTLDRYWNTEPKGFYPGYDPGIDGQRTELERLTDDNLWIGLSLIREYKSSNDPKMLERAIAIFDLVTSQWDESDKGIPWKVKFEGEENRDKGVVSNGPAIMLAAELYQLKHEARYLEWAEKIYDWVNTNLRDQDTGLYYDHVYLKNGKQEIDKGIGSYTQGVMIGAATMLSEINPEKYPQQDALDLAEKAMAHFRTQGYDRPSFTSIFFQNLLYLASSSRDETFIAKVQLALSQNIDEIATSKEKYGDLSDSAGIVSLLAMERIPRESYHKLY